MVANPEAFTCSVGVQFRAGESTTTVFPTILAANTFPSPSTVPAGGGFQFGLFTSEATPFLVQARVRANCTAGTAAQVRRLPVTFHLIDNASGRTDVVLQGVAQQ